MSVVYVAGVRLSLHVVPEQLKQGSSQKLLPVCGICFSSRLPCLASVGEKVLSLSDLKCQHWGTPS